MKIGKHYDIIVCGGGIAGTAAALSCARSGLKTCLIEKTCQPGGLATSGFINIYLPLCDGNGNQILYGVAEELLKASIKYGPGNIPKGWGGIPGEKKQRYQTVFSPAAFVIALEELLENTNVDIWYDTIVCGVRVSKNNRLEAVEVFNKSGKNILGANAFIDATGDADVAHLVGCELKEGKNFLSLWAIQANMEKAKSALSKNNPSLLLDVLKIGADDRGHGHPTGEKTWKGINGKNVSDFLITSRRFLRKTYITKNVKDNDNSLHSFPVALPSMPQFRKTRRIVGLENVTEFTGDISTISPSSQKCFFPDWRTRGRIWHLPSGALVPRGIKGLFVAGRIISVENDDAWDAARVIPVAAFTGEKAAELAMTFI